MPDEATGTESTAPVGTDRERYNGAINFVRLRTMMLARCLDQRSLAALSVLSEATVSLLSGRSCAPKSLKKLCLALAKTPVDDLAQELTRDGSE
jgi:DNA-binding Xre family transcriptional regulator